MRSTNCFNSRQIAARRWQRSASIRFRFRAASLTWFKIDRQGNVVGAINEVHAAGGTAYQTFKFDGFWKGEELVFPKHMEMIRDGQRFFTLDVSKFNGY